MNDFPLMAILQTVTYILISPALLGILRGMKARLQGRQGPRAYQVYLDIWKLLRKTPLLPQSSSWLFVAAPFLTFLIYCFLGMITPIFYLPANEKIMSSANGPPLADLLVIAYLLGMTHFVMGLAGMDSGSPFGGMGSSREMFLNLVAEPALILSIYALAIHAHTTSLPMIMNASAALSGQDYYGDPSIWLIFLALGLVLLAETGRVPFDNPGSHLELTMASKAISLEYSGSLLALLDWGEAMRLTFFFSLIANLFLPTLLSHSLDAPQVLLALGTYLLRLVLVALGVAVWEMSRVKLRLRMLINPGLIALSFSILAIFIAVARIYFI